MSLSAEERRTLLRLARAAIEEALRNDGSLQRVKESVTLTESLRTRRAAFVTLHESRSTGPDGLSALRGCIGSLEAHEPLFESVIRNAAHAAFDDPRFPRLDTHELPDLVIEVSALTPLRPVGGPGEIVVGRDGVELSHAGHRAVFLPQVAVDQGWNVETLLDHLARKAGLPFGDWKGAVLRTFEAEVFGEPCRHE